MDLIKGLEVALFIMVLLTVYFNASNRHEKKITGKEQFEESVIRNLYTYLKSKDGYFSINRIEKYLKRTGNSFNLTPLGYITIKVIISSIFLIFFVIGKSLLLALILAVIGFFLLDFSINYRDKKDMKEIKFELRDIYDSIKMQLIAGAFISDSLRECYLIVLNKRFKKSLAILSAEISMSQDIESSLNHFSERFKSDDINGFVLSIQQSLKTGKSKNQLDDQSEQLRDMNLIEIQQGSKKIDDTIDKISLLLFIGIFMVVLYFTIIQIPTNGIISFQ